MSSIEQKARDVSRPTLESVGRALARWNVSPDAVTYLGLLLTIGVAVLAALGQIRWAGVAYIVAALCDALDGTLARVSGKGSRFGAFLDSTIDRFEESIVFLGLSVYYARVVPGAWWGVWVVPLILVATVGSLMVSYTRARAEGVGVECKAGFMTRPPRVALLIVAMLLDLVPIGLAIIAVTSLLTTFQRMYYVWRTTGGDAGGWDPMGTSSPVPDPCAEQQQPRQDDGEGDEA
ncbi:MAG TPA: CDP-alcohol phosphatidyltransferase family protein [Anaerolineae bacterium]|nr:CDP-alcohol phosphatidyltransferase family protein [Anaerolineae bacterium]